MPRFVRVLALAGVWLAFSGSGARAATVHTWKVDVDGDGHVETLRLVRAGTAHPRQYHLELLDRVHGRRVVMRLSPNVDSMEPRGVMIRDLNDRPHRKEIFYWGMNGTTGGDTFAGIVNWDGGWLHSFWRYRPPYPPRSHDGHVYGTAGGVVRVLHGRSAGSAPKHVQVVEAEYGRYPTMCCPPWSFDRRLRYDPSTRRWVVYHRRWVKG